MTTGPEQGKAIRDQFIRSHAETPWACDFVQQRILTLKGWKDAYLLVFVNVATRRAVATSCTEHPDAAWVAEQAAGLRKLTGKGGCRVLTRDRDTRFGKAFDGALRGTGVTPVRLPHCAPNLNAHMERFIQTVQNECLNRFIVMGTGHLDHLVGEYMEHYNTERPHSGIGFRTPVSGCGPVRLHGARGAVRCRTRLGGVLRSYYRAAGWAAPYLASRLRNTGHNELYTDLWSCIRNMHRHAWQLRLGRGDVPFAHGCSDHCCAILVVTVLYSLRVRSFAVFCTKGSSRCDLKTTYTF